MIFLSSCQTPKSIEPVAAPKREPKVALVLGGGSAKGFAHVGVIRVLEQEKIPVNMIVGTSVGSLIGSIYASNPDGFQLEWLAFKIEKSDILDFSIVYSKMGPVQGAKLESFVERNVAAKRIEDTKIPFFPVATDLNTGETVTLEKGSMARAVHASCAIPGIFAPVTFDKRMLVDGGVTDNVACDIARKKGADIIIGVSLQKDVKNYQIDSAIDVIAQSINIMAREASRSKLECADVIIEPDLHGVPLFDFSQKKLMMEEGIKATGKAVPKIQSLLAKYR
ncbi:MAG TPA: patatin-like phospholipase family protein [Syntrophorhabdales bacterium]|nr:patatin-like phospholipase family protein [Syntrophorhabdales bacterium]